MKSALLSGLLVLLLGGCRSVLPAALSNQATPGIALLSTPLPTRASVPAGLPSGVPTVTPSAVPSTAAAELLTQLLLWDQVVVPLFGTRAVASADAALAAQYGTEAYTVSALQLGGVDRPLLSIAGGVVTAGTFSQRFACAQFLVALDPGSWALISIVPLDAQLKPCAAALQLNPGSDGQLRVLSVPSGPTAVPPAALPDAEDVSPALESALVHLERNAGEGPFFLVAVAAAESALQVLALTPEGPLHLFLRQDQAGTWRVVAQFTPPLDLERLQRADLPPELAFPPPTVDQTALALLLEARQRFSNSSVLFTYDDPPTGDIVRLAFVEAGNRAPGTALLDNGRWVFVRP